MTTPSELPARFDDSTGRAWHLAIDVTRCRSLKALGLDVANLTNGKIFTELGADWLKLAAGLYVLCERQAEAAGLSEEDFGVLLDARTLEAAAKAFEEAIVNFTPPAKRATVQTLIAKAHQAIERADAEGVALLESEETTAMMDRTLKAAVADAKRRLMGGV